MRKIISCFMAVIFVVLEIQFPIAVNAQTEADFEKLIFRYYEMIKKKLSILKYPVTVQFFCMTRIWWM